MQNFRVKPKLVSGALFNLLPFRQGAAIKLVKKKKDPYFI